MVKRFFISIRNIPWTISSLEFEKYFSAFGNIKHAKLIFNRHGLSTGCGFIEYYDISAMQNVLQATHTLEEEKLSVVKGTKYIQEENLEEFVSKYIPYKYMSNQVESFPNEKYIQQKNHQFTNRDNYFHNNKNSTAKVFENINKLLKERRK